MTSRPVVATTGGITLAGVVATGASIIQALNGHPTNVGSLLSGNFLTAIGIVGTLFHVHNSKGNEVATQNDVENVVDRIRKAWNSIKSPGGVVQRAELDLSSAIKLAEELEAEAEKLTGSPSSVPSETPSAPSEAVSPAAPPVDASSDFSALTKE